MAASQWPQQYQQYQQKPQQYQQSQQYSQGQQYQQSQQYQQNQQYQAQQYPQSQQYQPTQQYQPPPKTHSTQQSQQQPQGYPMQQYQQNQQYQTQHYQQPQQGHPTQHYQQAQQGPPAQQYPQIQPAQPAQQYPQQPQQGHSGYQHQHAPQKHISQQYAPHQPGSHPQYGSPPVHNSPLQHGTPQYGAYQQARQPQGNPAHKKSPAQAAPQPCFNCGNSGHFAMDCPEPIRDVPAGRVNPQAFQNPLRRPKNGVNVATQHQYTAHPGHPQVSPKGYPPPPHGQTGYPQNPQYQQPYSPATPLSAHSPAQAQYYQQWQQYYQSQQAYQESSEHQQGSPYHQQPHAAPHGQAVGHLHGSQTPSHVPVQASQFTGGPEMYQSQSTPASTTPVQFNQRHSINEATTQPDQRTQSSVSMKSQSTPPSPHQAQLLDYDFEEDDLDSLDIPELPQTRLLFTNASQQPINLIGQPLPGNSVVADALAPFPQPAPQDEGCCRSKYQYDGSLEACLEHFNDLKYWDKEHADDVAFSYVPSNGKIIPVDEILSTIRQRRAHPESSDDFNRDTRSQSRTVSMNQDSLDVKNTLDRMERELAETKAKLEAKLNKGRATIPVQTPPLRSVKSDQPPHGDHKVKEEDDTPPQYANSEEPIKSERDAEDVLAALGVTGAPKPVTANAWPDQYLGHGSPNDRHMSRSRSSSRADILIGDQYRVQSNPSQVAPEHQANGSSSYNPHFGPPPPPPIPFRQQSYPDGTVGSPLPAGLASVNPFGYNTNDSDHSNSNGNVNRYFSPATDEQAPSPIELRSEKSHSRKRHRDSSFDEEDTPKRRQEDDFTPKLKKRQPKVAEAYSRRW